MPRFLVLFLFLLAACGPASQEPIQPMGAPSLRPYQTGTPATTSTPTGFSTLAFLPTPTPVQYTIQSGDTLEAIARRYGVPLESLLAANPGVQPAALQVGAVLTIPLGNSQPAQQASPTPAILAAQQARCWGESAGGWWCFALLPNEYPEALENLSVQFTLADEAGAILASQAVAAPLNLLPAGQVMPVGAYFTALPQPPAVVHVQVLTATRLLAGVDRYLPAQVDNTVISIHPGGRSAQAAGQVILQQPPEQDVILWVLAAAYDRQGNLVGFRRWEGSATSGDSAIPFSLLISSLGPEIWRVELLVEAQPPAISH